MKKSILLVLASLFVMSCSSTVSKENTMEKSNKEKAVELLGVFETRSSKPIEYINPNKYIQHNLGAADGGLSTLFRTIFIRSFFYILQVFYNLVIHEYECYCTNSHNQINLFLALQNF